ncbi:unnamed protein product [Sympodiomycopsis kandeliae]
MPVAKYMTIPALLKDLQVYQGLTFITFGIQLWEHLLTLHFEWEVYSGKLPWKHGMIAYMLIRYATWTSLIPTMINICTTNAPIDCQGSLNAILIGLCTAVIFTSLVFIIRCIAVWNKNVWVLTLLGSLWTAEAVMQLTSPSRMKSEWINGACQTSFTTSSWKFNFAYLLVEVTDIATFALAAWKLRDMRSMGLGKVLFQQSVSYIGISTLLNTVCLILIYLNLNPVLSYLMSPFTMTISGILACRSFRDLQLAGHQSNPELCFMNAHSITWTSATRHSDPSRTQQREQQQQSQTQVSTHCGAIGRQAQSVIESRHGDVDADDAAVLDSINKQRLCGCKYRPASLVVEHHDVVDQHDCDPSTRQRGDSRQSYHRRLGKSKSDWLQRSGLGGTTTTTTSLPRPATAPMEKDVEHDMTTTGIGTTSFLGFLLDEERAGFHQQEVQRKARKDADIILSSSGTTIGGQEDVKGDIATHKAISNSSSTTSHRMLKHAASTCTSLHESKKQWRKPIPNDQVDHQHDHEHEREEIFMDDDGDDDFHPQTAFSQQKDRERHSSSSFLTFPEAEYDFQMDDNGSLTVHSQFEHLSSDTSARKASLPRSLSLTTTFGRQYTTQQQMTSSPIARATSPTNGPILSFDDPLLMTSNPSPIRALPSLPPPPRRSNTSNNTTAKESSSASACHGSACQGSGSERRLRSLGASPVQSHRSTFIDHPEFAQDGDATSNFVQH